MVLILTYIKRFIFYSYHSLWLVLVPFCFCFFGECFLEIVTCLIYIGYKITPIRTMSCTSFFLLPFCQIPKKKKC